MMFADRAVPRVLPQRRFVRDYVMMFRAGPSGVAKRVEFQARDESRAVALALADRACGAVDILENGEFLLRLSCDACGRDEDFSE